MGWSTFMHRWANEARQRIYIRPSKGFLLFNWCVYIFLFSVNSILDWQLERMWYLGNICVSLHKQKRILNRSSIALEWALHRLFPQDFILYASSCGGIKNVWRWQFKKNSKEITSNSSPSKCFNSAQKLYFSKFSTVGMSFDESSVVYKITREIHFSLFFFKFDTPRLPISIVLMSQIDPEQGHSCTSFFRKNGFDLNFLGVCSLASRCTVYTYIYLYLFRIIDCTWQLHYDTLWERMSRLAVTLFVELISVALLTDVLFGLNIDMKSG